MIDFPSTPSNGQIATLNGTSYIWDASRSQWRVNAAPAVEATIAAELSSPSPIGDTTPNTGAFTTLSASGAVSGDGFSNYLASPPAIGATSPNTGKFSQIETVAGTTSLPPFKLNAGTLLTTAVQGALEFASTDNMLHFTPNTVNGRGYIPVDHLFVLEANGSNTATTISPFFGSNSAIPLEATGLYEIEFFCLFLKNTAGTLVWTFTSSAAPVNMAIQGEMSAITGSGTTGTWAAPLAMTLPNRTAAAVALPATGSLTNAANHFAKFRVIVKVNASNANIRLNVTNSAGTITPQRGSYWKVRRIDGVGAVVA